MGADCACVWPGRAPPAPSAGWTGAWPSAPAGREQPGREADRPHAALPELLATLQGQGYRLVPVSTLVARLSPGPPRPKPPRTSHTEEDGT